jgi:hypothetical protein
MKLELARVGAVRRAACAEPICGGNSPSARRPRRRRSSGAGAVGGRELLRRNHEGSQERGCSLQRAGGRLPSTTRPELVRAGAVRRAACAEPICGGNSPSARRLRRETHAGPSHGGSDDGGAPGGCAGCGSCSGATTKACRRGGVCVSELGGARRPRLGRSLCGWAGGLPSLGVRERWLPLPVLRRKTGSRLPVFGSKTGSLAPVFGSKTGSLAPVFHWKRGCRVSTLDWTGGSPTPRSSRGWWSSTRYGSVIEKCAFLILFLLFV